MEQILIVADDSETDKNNLKQTVSYLCELYKISSAGMDKVINDRVHDSVTARYLITAVTTLRNSNFIVDMFMHASRDEDVMEQLNAAIINLYASNDKLYNDISDAVVKVNNLKNENDDIRKIFESEIKAAFEREKETTKELIEQYKVSIEAKDKTYTLIMHNNNEIKKENGELKEQLNKLKVKNDELKAMMTLKAKSSMTDRDIHVSGTANEKEKSGLLSIFRKDRNNRNNSISQHMDEFISEILSNKDFSKEQKDYLMSCVESGMSYNEVKRIANKELDVDMMKRVVNYYKRKK